MGSVTEDVFQTVFLPLCLRFPLRYNRPEPYRLLYGVKLSNLVGSLLCRFQLPFGDLIKLRYFFFSNSQQAEMLYQVANHKEKPLHCKGF